MIAKINKVDLTLLHKLVKELEDTLEVSYKEDKPVELIIELSKAVGLASSIFQESGLLIADIQSQILVVQNPSPTKSDFLDKLMSTVKGAGTNNGNTN